MLSHLRHRAPAANREGFDERGDTLVEVLIAIVILGGAVVALLGGLLTTTAASVSHRSLATVDAVLTSFAETARSSIQLQPNGSYTACTVGHPVNYTVVGSPNPRSGPPGSVVDVFGTGIPVTPGGPIGGASLGGTALAAKATSSSSPTGAISEFTVPTMPAGTYSVYPFGSTYPAAASSFTIIPTLGGMSPASASTGPGSTVKVTVGGFAKNATLTVRVGTTPAAVNSGNPMDSNGNGTVVFTVPSPLTGSQSSQQVTISDGTNTTTETLFIASDTGTPNPVQTVSSYANDTLKMSVAYWNPDSGSNWTTDTSWCTGSKFNPDIQQLNFTLQDNQPNNGADGGTSIVVANFLPQSVAAPPVDLTATSYQNGQVPLQWNAPGYTGTSSITSYNIYRSTTAGSIGTRVASTSATTYTDTGLTNGTNYYYQVTAVNSSGESAPSTPQASATPATTPGPPTSVSAAPGNTTVTVNWSPPASNGGAAITGYNVYRSTASGVQGTKVASVSGSTTSYTDTGRINGTTYYYEVTAVNPAGEGPVSSQVSATPATPPGAPTALLATPGNGQVQLSWTAPLSNGGSAITGYNVYRSNTPGTPGLIIGSTIAGTTTYTDSTVVNGTPYYYEVTAVNVIGESAPSVQVPAIPLGVATVPSAPTLNSATAGGNGSNRTVTLSWSPPGSNGGSALTGYTVYGSTNGGTFSAIATVGPSSTTYLDQHLTHNATYTYYVVANNSVGPSPASNQKSATP